MSHALMLRRCAPVFAAAALAAPAAATAQVAAHSTYTWAPVNAQMLNGPDARLTNQSFQTRMKGAIDHALAQKGLKKVDAKPQLLVAYHVGVAAKNETRPARNPMPASPCASPGCSAVWGVYGPPQVDMRNVRYSEGTLIIDLLNPHTSQLVFRGTSKTRLRGDKATDARLNEVVGDALKALKVGG